MIGIWLVANLEANTAIVNNLTQLQLGQLVLKLEFFAGEWSTVSCGCCPACSLVSLRCLLVGRWPWC